MIHFSLILLQLRQEIEDHHGYINSICFDDDDDGLKMYSADSAGVINVWNVFVTSQPDGRGKSVLAFRWVW